MLTEKFDAALLFAADLHRKQARKGTGTPYFGHLLAVAALVIDDGGSEDEAIGALLHDSIEDQGQHYPGGREALRTYIREQFGSAVADIVDACTDDEGLSKESMGTPQEDRARWLERKQAYVDGIGHKTAQALRVTAADKVHNAESILDAYSAIGPEIWNRFRTRSRADQTDVYEALSRAIDSRNRALVACERTRLPERLLRAVGLMKELA